VALREDIIRDFDKEQTPLDALALWDARLATLEFVRASENFVYRFRDSADKERYLRIAHHTHRNRKAIEAELEYVNFLAENGAEVAAPVAARDGQFIQTRDTPIGAMFAGVFEAVYGQKVKWGKDAHNRALLHERGRALARLHNISEKFKPGALRRDQWFEDTLFTKPWEILPQSEVIARREYQELVQWLSKRPRTPANYGMVHGDYGTLNTLRRDGTLVAFDFDDCGWHWYLYDLAVAIRSARKLPDEYRKAYIKVLIEGYSSERSMDGEGVETVAKFCRLAALYRYVSLRRKYDFSNLLPDQKELVEQRLEVLANPPVWV
jgi:Ser/Thr protein kinase RdoA (MazF antagonist)